MCLSCVLKTCLLIKYCRTVSISRLGKTVLFRNGHTTMPITYIIMQSHDIGNPSVRYYPCPSINPLNAELNPICYLLALLAHHFLHVSRIRIKSLTLRLLRSYIYIYIYMYDISSLRVKYESTVGHAIRLKSSLCSTIRLF